MSLSSLHDAIDNWKLNTDRPFSSLETNEIEQGTIEGLTFSRPDLETATLALAELKPRTKHAARLAEEHINSRLREINHRPIPWLLRVRENLKILTFKDEPNENYTNSLYVILRDGYTEQNGRYGVYVGQTTRTPEDRFEEHMAGINAGNGLQKNGIQLMRSLMWPWQKVPGAMRLYYESALHKALEIGNTSGPKVSGDAKEVETWPAEFQEPLAKLVESHKKTDQFNLNNHPTFLD